MTGEIRSGRSRHPLTKGWRTMKEPGSAGAKYKSAEVERHSAAPPPQP